MRWELISKGNIPPKKVTQLGCGAVYDSVSSTDSNRKRFFLAKDPFRRAANHADKKWHSYRRIAAEMSVHDRGIPIGHGERRNEAGGDCGGDGQDHAVAVAEPDRITIEEEFGGSARLECNGLQSGTKANFGAIATQARERRLDEGLRKADPRHERAACQSAAPKRLSEDPPEELSRSLLGARIQRGDDERL